MTPLGEVTAVTQEQVHIYTALSWALLILDGLVGLLILWRRWHAAVRDDEARVSALPARHSLDGFAA